MIITVGYSLTGTKEIEVTPEKFSQMTEDDFRDLAWETFKEDFSGNPWQNLPECPDSLCAHTDEGDELYFEVYPKFLEKGAGRF